MKTDAECSPDIRETQAVDDGPKLGRILVFTSNQCPFCGEALRLAKEAARRLHYYSQPLEVIEARIENNRDILEQHKITAVPTIKIGQAILTGLPKIEDVEQVIHETMLTERLTPSA